MNELDANLQFNQQRLSAELWLKENENNDEISPFFIQFVKEALKRIKPKQVTVRDVTEIESDPLKRRIRNHDARIERRRVRARAEREVKAVWRQKISLPMQKSVIEYTGQLDWFNSDGEIHIDYSEDGYACPRGISYHMVENVPSTAIIAYVALNITQTLKRVPRKAVWVRNEDN